MLDFIYNLVVKKMWIFLMSSSVCVLNWCAVSCKVKAIINNRLLADKDGSTYKYAIFLNNFVSNQLVNVYL